MSPLVLRLAGASFVICAAAGCGRSSSQPAASPSPIAQGGCGAGLLCFNVFTAVPGPIGPTTLFLMWTPVGDGGDNGQGELVQLAQLSGSEHSLTLPFASIAVPRAPSEWKMWWGYVFAMPVGQEPRPKGAVGITPMMLVHADPEWLGMQQHMQNRFPAGIAAGTAPYAMQRTDGSMFDKFVLGVPGRVFDLVFCPVTQPNCELPWPNPT
jgi:hypothetical protein